MYYISMVGYTKDWLPTQQNWTYGTWIILVSITVKTQYLSSPIRSSVEFYVSDMERNLSEIWNQILSEILRKSLSPSSFFIPKVFSKNG